MKFILLVSLIITCRPSSAQDKVCDYFNLTPPSTTPQEFNPEILGLSPGFKFNVELKHCDVFYFTTIDEKENIYYGKKKNHEWSKPKIASFSDPDYSDADPFLNKTGDIIYFISERPTNAEDEKLDWNIWYATLEGNKWSEPHPLPKPINSPDADEYFFSISDDGNAYFSSNRAGGHGSFDIYTTKVLGNNIFTSPKNVGQPLSSQRYEFDPYISPDESFIVFSLNEAGNSSLHLSVKDSLGAWSEPINLGNEINTTNQDFAPSLSGDGKYLFYSNNGKLKWASVDRLKTIIKR